MSFNLANAVLSFFREHQRILPWRENPTPYRVLVSEIMLQQTRVETVIPYYERFVTQCPDFLSLSLISDETLYFLWQGLGYYSRARNLRKTAQIVVEQYEGNLPDDSERLRLLPGIGDYTAQAILSIAFHKPAVAVDGNVLRVFTRYWGVYKPIEERSTKMEIRTRLLEEFPIKHASEFVQGLMEIGATICVPNGAPKCDVCPLAEWCYAKQTKSWTLLPIKKHKPEKKIERYHVYLMSVEDQIVLRKRSDKGLLLGMFEFPNSTDDIPVEEWIDINHLEVESVAAPFKDKHVFTHVIWEYEIYQINLKSVPSNVDWMIVKRDEIGSLYPLPTAFSKLLK